MSIEAAIRGEGVALGRSVLVAEDLAAGRLVSLFPEARLEVEYGYDLVYRLGNHDDPKEEIAALTALRDKPSGSIRLTLSDHALESVVWPKLKPVLRDYPDIGVELILDSTFRNIVEEGFDAGVRLGESVEKDMIAVRIGPDWRLVAVASPGYLAEHGVPEHPQDLVRHRCINMRHETAGGLYAWEFEKDGQELRVRVDGQLTFNNSYAMIDAAVNGYGVAYIPEDIVEPQIAAGSLVRVLDDWSPFFDGYFLYYPSRRQNLPAFKVIVEALRHRG